MHNKVQGATACDQGKIITPVALLPQSWTSTTRLDLSIALTMGESIFQSTYRSKQELVDAGLHLLSSSDAYCKDDYETCVFSVLSGSHHKNKCHKDMGGLLQEGGRDFLV